MVNNSRDLVAYGAKNGEDAASLKRLRKFSEVKSRPPKAGYAVRCLRDF